MKGKSERNSSEMFGFKGNPRVFLPWATLTRFPRISRGTFDRFEKPC